MLKKLLAALRTDRPVLMFLNFCEGIVDVYIKGITQRWANKKSDEQCKVKRRKVENKGRH